MYLFFVFSTFVEI